MVGLICVHLYVHGTLIILAVSLALSDPNNQPRALRSGLAGPLPEGHSCLTLRSETRYDTLNLAPVKIAKTAVHGSDRSHNAQSKAFCKSMSDSSHTRDCFYGPNAGYVLALYEQYQADPDSVDADTRAYFDSLGAEPVNIRLDGAAISNPRFVQQPSMIAPVLSAVF